MKRSIIKSFLIGLIFSVTALCGILMLNNFKTDRKVEVKADSVTGTEISASDSGSQYYGNEYRGQIIVKSGSTYTMTGGVIDGANKRLGSAFYVENGATLDLAGGSIINNHSKWGVIYVEAGGKVNISGEFKFENNVTENSNVTSSSILLPICAENLEDVVISEGATITATNNTSAIYDVEVVLCVEQSDGTVSYQRAIKEAGYSFEDYGLSVNLIRYNGYFTDENYLDVLDRDAEIVNTYNTGCLMVYSKAATNNYSVFETTDTACSLNVSTSATGEVVLPSEINGLPVTEFLCMSRNVTGIVLGDNIETIRQQYLFNSGITTLNVNSNVKNYVPYTDYSKFTTTTFSMKNYMKLQYINVSDKNLIFTDLDSNGLFNKTVGTLLLGASQTTLNKGGASIGQSAFLGSVISKPLTIPSFITTIGDGAFAYSQMYTVQCLSVSSKQPIIGDYAFAGCLNLGKVTLSKYCVAIGQAAFFNCKNLLNINIHTNLRSIGNMAFAYSGIDGEIVLNPSSRLDVGNIAFAYCNNLDYIYYGGNVWVPQLYTNASGMPFTGCNNLIVATDLGENIATNWVFGAYWNYYDGSNYCTTYYGITLAEGQTIADAIAASGQTANFVNSAEYKEGDMDLSVATVCVKNETNSPTVHTLARIKQDDLEPVTITLNNKKQEYVILLKEENDN